MAITERRAVADLAHQMQRLVGVAYLDATVVRTVLYDLKSTTWHHCTQPSQRRKRTSS